MIDKMTLQEKIKSLASRRQSLVELLEEPNLGTLRLDVNQALEELDELIEDFKVTFPEVKLIDASSFENRAND